MKEIKDKVTGLWWGLVACAIITLLTGCRTREYVPVETVRTVYQDRVRTVHDTVLDTVLSHSFILQKDSMAVEVKGDTVYIDRWHTLTIRSLEKASHRTGQAIMDSASATRTDSMRVPLPVERKLTRWEQVKMDAGGIAIAVAIIAIIAGIVGWLRKKARSNI